MTTARTLLAALLIFASAAATANTITAAATPPASPKAASAAGVDAYLPEGPGKTEVMQVCTRCHGVNLLAQRRSADEWSQVMGRMIGNGALMDDEQYSVVLAYLNKHLGDEAGGAGPGAAPAGG